MSTDRRYFANLFVKSRALVEKLEQKLKRNLVIVSGTRVTVENITFIFFKRGSDKENLAKYNGRKVIKVYVNNFFEEATDFEFLKKGIPKKMKDTLMHEISHLEEDSRGVMDSGLFPNFEKDDYEYYNSNSEVNARIVEFLNVYLTKEVMDEAQNGNMNRVFSEMLGRVMTEHAVSHFNLKNRNRLVKIMYSTFIRLVADAEGR